MNRTTPKIWSRLKEPPFLIALVVATVLWYLINLNHTYQKDVTIPLYIDGIENPAQSGQDRYFNIYCRVKASGYKLLYTYLFPKSNIIKSDISQIISSNEDSHGSYTLDRAALENLISSNLKDIELIKLLDSNVRLKNIHYTEKRVKVFSALKVNMERGYMMAGDVKISPTHVNIMGDYDKINAIDSVSTIATDVEVGGYGLISEVELKPISGVTILPNKITLTVESTRFTEQTLTKNVEVLIADTLLQNTPPLSVIPACIELRINLPLERIKEFNTQNITPYINYGTTTPEDLGGDNKYKVKVAGVPSWCELIDIYPSYITILRN